MLTCEVKKVITEISSKDSSVKRLCVASWNGKPNKLDLRVWHVDQGLQPGMGITLDATEARAAAIAILNYLDEAPQDSSEAVR